MYIEFKNKFAEFPLISLVEIQKAFPNLDKRRLFEWAKKGYLKLPIFWRRTTWNKLK